MLHGAGIFTVNNWVIFGVNVGENIPAPWFAYLGFQNSNGRLSTPGRLPFAASDATDGRCVFEHCLKARDIPSENDSSSQKNGGALAASLFLHISS